MTPTDLPEPITGPSVWVAHDLERNEAAWLHHLTTDEIAELEAAADHFQTLGKDLGQISADDFPLSNFRTHLNALTDTLLHGTGVEVMRGLPTNSYDQR